MGQTFAEVSADDFSKITLDPLPHQAIETALTTMGGGGSHGVDYKLEMLKMAGWKGNKLTSFAKDPEGASKAFNKIRKALKKTDNADDLRNLLDKPKK